jgi:hypothetical protein
MIKCLLEYKVFVFLVRASFRRGKLVSVSRLENTLQREDGAGTAGPPTKTVSSSTCCSLGLRVTTIGSPADQPALHHCFYDQLPGYRMIQSGSSVVWGSKVVV